MKEDYAFLRHNPPILKVKKDPRVVEILTISCMCNNKGGIIFRKNDDGDYSMSGRRFSLNNWQFKHSVIDIEWVASEQDWEEVFRMINTGTSAIHSVRSK